ncbi:MAG TPA: rRNA pseudouridine synthase, partial [candidate division Zixibacteria bacterium]|nr:rRNA pseudouridine synthase [candidate division Zixibacteria bacterium]
MKKSIVRINKYLSLCGVTSRRGADNLISEKRVTINDITVEQLGQSVDMENDIVKVDGTIVEVVEQKVYVLFNKPQNVMTTLHDPFRRKTVLDFLKDLPVRVYPVGRLDYDTEGVLLLTNDEDMAYQLTHPKFQIEKIYDVKVAGHFTTA